MTRISDTAMARPAGFEVRERGSIAPVEALEIVRAEFDSQPGSFMLMAWAGTWDREAFQRLQRAMREVCESIAGQSTIERWIAEGFWFVEHFVREVCGRPDYPDPQPADYCEAACDRMFDLSYWLFHGESPYLPVYTWPDL